MTEFEIYQFLLCLITFSLLTVLFTVLVTWLIRLMLRLIKSGLEDEKIKKDYLKSLMKKHTRSRKLLEFIVLFLFCTIFLLSFAFSAFVGANEGKVVTDIPVISVVKSGSMSYINEDHKYLKPGEVTDQIQMYDLVVINKLPKEEDLKVNDIVIYKTDGIAIIHRIVAIEEPNQHHSDRRFLLHGDANKSADYFPVLYDQMIGIYSGTRVPFIGNFILFMQSPSGYLCILLLIFAIISVPLAEKRINRAIKARLLAMGLLDFMSYPYLFDEDESLYTDPVTFEKIRVIDGQKQQMYRCRRAAPAKLSMDDSTLNVHLKSNENINRISVHSSKSKKRR